MKYELVLCVVNSGFAGDVMDAAREAGARGGTIIRGRGTAAKEAEEYFHITVQPEKDVVMIVVGEDIKDGVLSAVYKKAGLGTRGQGIAFSIPVLDAVGLGDAHEEKEGTEE